MKATHPSPFDWLADPSPATSPRGTRIVTNGKAEPTDGKAHAANRNNNATRRESGQNQSEAVCVFWPSTPQIVRGLAKLAARGGPSSIALNC
jgi:hypothetical protein